MKAEKITKPRVLRTIRWQLMLFIGSTVVGISVFWLLMVLLDDIRGGVSLDNFFFMVAIMPFFIAAGTLIFPFYLLSLLAIKFLVKHPSVITYAAFGALTGLLGTCFNLKLVFLFEPDRWAIHALAAIAAAAAGFFHGHFDLKYAYRGQEA